MAAGNYSFTIEQGATTDLEVVYTDSTNTPVNLTGYTARMQIRPSAGVSEIYLTLSSSLGPCGTGLNLSGSNGSTPLSSGSIGIFISAATSSLLNFDNAQYDLEIASGSGNCAVVTRLLKGNIRLSKEITKGSY